MENKVMSPGEWALTVFLTGLPLIGLILLIVWAVGDDSNLSRKNYAKGSLILFAIAIAFGIAFFVFGGLALLSNARY